MAIQKVSCLTTQSQQLSLPMITRKWGGEGGEAILTAINTCTTCSNLEQYLKNSMGKIKKITIIHTGKEINRKRVEKNTPLLDCNWSEYNLKSTIIKIIVYNSSANSMLQKSPQPWYFPHMSSRM